MEDINAEIVSFEILSAITAEELTRKLECWRKAYRGNVVTVIRDLQFSTAKNQYSVLIIYGLAERKYGKWYN